MKKYFLVLFFLCFATKLLAQEQVMFCHFIDMGQGLAVILQFPNGVVMIDAGSQNPPASSESKKKVLDYLRNFFTANPQYNWTIDAIIVTHNHFDHTGSIPAIYSDGNFTIKNIVSTKHKIKKEVKKVARDSNINSYFVEYVDVLANLPNGMTNATIDPLGSFNGVNPEIKIFTGRSKSWRTGPFSNPNFHSLAIRVKFGDASFLFIGDMQEHAIEYMLRKYANDLDVFDVDVYQVGHHGSHNATTPGLLDALSPKIAIISAGHKEDQRTSSGFDYGHPNEGVIDTLSNRITGTRNPSINGYAYKGHQNLVNNKTISNKIYCTCWDGNVVIRSTSDGEYTVMVNQ